MTTDARNSYGENKKEELRNCSVPSAEEVQQYKNEQITQAFGTNYDFNVRAEAMFHPFNKRGFAYAR